MRPSNEIIEKAEKETMNNTFAVKAFCWEFHKNHFVVFRVIKRANWTFEDDLYYTNKTGKLSKTVSVSKSYNI